MGKVVEKKRKKKKGRPSLLDLQKRNLRLQKQQQQQQQNKRNPNPNPSPNPYANPRNPNPNRRFTRRNPISDETAAAASPERAGDGAVDDDDDEEDEEEEEDLNGRRRREKKLKFVLRLPSNQQNHGSLSDSPYLNWGLYGSDSNAEEEENVEAPKKKRKINAVGHHGSGRVSDGEKGEKKQYSTSKTTGTNLATGTSIEAGPTTALPDKKLLVFILDRLQKKDSYGVFSEPVDPKELPDYHEVIKHPMDFSTVRKKLNAGVYSNLEEFEKDVFLICSNAMQYNAPDTIYFRQARSINELAKKNFENLRQESDDNEPEPKIAARRGRPPTKKVKKPSGMALFERAGSEFSSDATLATAGENGGLSNTYNLRKGPVSDRHGVNDATGRASRNNEPYSRWLAEHKSERNDEFPGTIPKGFSSKFGKKQLVIDENRRSTYNPYHQSIGGHEPSVLTTFDVEKKHLMAVGLPTKHGYARSLARFAANLGPVAWKVASKKIERALPAGVNFGPGWVVENESVIIQQPLPSTASPQQTMRQQPSPLPNISSSTTPPRTTSSLASDGNASTEEKLLNNPVLYSLKNSTFPMSTSVSSTTTPPTSSIVISEGNKSLEEKPSNNPVSVLDSLKSRTLPKSSSPSSSSVVNRFHPESVTKCLETSRLNNGSGSDLLSSSGSFIRPSFQVNQNHPMLNPALNGLSGGFCASLVSQMTKSASPAWPSGSYSSGSDTSLHSQRPNMLSRNNFAASMPAMRLETQNPMVSGTSNSVISSTSSPNASLGTPAGPGAGVHLKPSWQALSTQQRPDSAPPDLNLRFQSPGSPKSGARADSPQTDLALQL